MVACLYLLKEAQELIRKTIVGLVIVCLVCGCGFNQHKVSILDLNGTWNRYSDNLSNKDIKRIIDGIAVDPKMKQDFSWGSGLFNPNGSWFFDICNDYEYFFIDGRPKYSITRSEVINDEIVLFISDDKEMQGNAKMIVKFIRPDRISIENPDKQVFRNGGPVILYRLSEPVRK